MATLPTVLRVAIEDLPSHLPFLEQELEDAGLIELVRGEKVVAELTPKHAQHAVPEAGERYIPDFKGRMIAMFGEKPMDTDITTFLREERDSRD